MSNQSAHGLRQSERLLVDPPSADSPGPLRALPRAPGDPLVL